MRQFPDGCVDCCVTSPPYFGLRDYGMDGQLGLEPTPDGYVDRMVDVFREVRRLLKPTGTLWLNIGDSYAANRGYQVPDSKHIDVGNSQGAKVPDGYKAKDLLMIPAMLAIALRKDGWYLRSDIIWSKPNPMPESVTDRPSCAHEHVFLLSKSAKYYYDAAAIATPMKNSSLNRLAQDVDAQAGSERANGGAKSNGNMKAVQKKDKQRGHSRKHAGFNDRWDSMTREEQQSYGANARNVWEIATKPFRGAHFATFPPELPRRCIVAGCPVKGWVFDPFMGSGTTGQVAEENGRHWFGCELNPEYIKIARNRTAYPCTFSGLYDTDAEPC